MWMCAACWWGDRSLRRGASRTMFYSVMAPMLGVAPAEAMVAEDLATLKRALRIMNGWLTKTRYLAGEEVSIADLRSVGCGSRGEK